MKYFNATPNFGRPHLPINAHLFTVWLRSCLNYHCVLPRRNQSGTDARQDPALLAHVAMPVSGSSWRPGAATADGGIAPQLFPCCQSKSEQHQWPYQCTPGEVRGAPICLDSHMCELTLATEVASTFTSMANLP
jgi:hypothetical protein